MNNPSIDPDYDNPNNDNPVTQSPAPYDQEENNSIPLRIVLADDHALVTEGLRGLIDQQPDMVVVAAVENGDQLLELLEKPDTSSANPDVVVLDLQMPFSGFDVLRALSKQSVESASGVRPKQSGDEVRFLILTAFADGESIQTALQLGADGFALKTESPTQTLDAIRQVAKGRLVFPRSARRWITAQNQPKNEAPPLLSPRERDVLAHLAQGRSNSEIAEALVVSENTIRFHLKNIYQKLQVNNRTEAAAWFLQN